MNSLPQALKAAGVKLPPIKQRIWLWLKDHPHKTARDLSVVMHLPVAQVCAQMLKMKQRGMVTARLEPARRPGMGRRSFEYAAVGTTYELKHVSAGPTPNPTIHPGKGPSGPVVDVTNSTVHLTTVKVPDMPLARAYALYQELKGYFAS